MQLRHVLDYNNKFSYARGFSTSERERYELAYHVLNAMVQCAKSCGPPPYGENVQRLNSGEPISGVQGKSITTTLVLDEFTSHMDRDLAQEICEGILEFIGDEDGDEIDGGTREDGIWFYLLEVIHYDRGLIDPKEWNMYESRTLRIIYGGVHVDTLRWMKPDWAIHTSERE